MAQIGPKFKGDAGKIAGYLNTADIEEIASALESASELDIDGLVVSEDLLNIKKDIVGASGKKVDIIQSEELDVILEVMR